MADNNRQVYFSYAWGGESERIVNELDADLQAKGIQIIRDKRDLGFKGMIRDFMEQIGRGHAVIVVISDKYLKSPNCMFELVEISKNKDFHDRIFPIVLADADIYNPVNRIKYIKHWEDKLKELDEAMKTVSGANLQGLRAEIDSYDEIRDNISNLTYLLKDMNTLTPEMHEGSDFATLINMLEKRIAEGGGKPEAAAKPAATPAPSLAKTPAAPSSGTPGKSSDYLAKVLKKMSREGYEEVKGERFGDLRFNLVLDRVVDEGFWGTDLFRMVVWEEDTLSDDRFIELEKEMRNYCKATYTDKELRGAYFTCLLLTNQISDTVKEMVYDTKTKDASFSDTFASVMVVYSALHDDVYYPKDLPNEYSARYEEDIKDFLIP